MPNELARKTALVIGAGGLGGPALLTLGGAGIGRLVVVDSDAVETSNLNRQPLFGEADLGSRKAVSAARRLSRLYPGVRVDVVDGRFDAATASGLVADADVLLDGSDNFETKFLANDVAVASGKPLVHGGILRYTAQLLTVLPGRTACLRCLFEAPPEEGAVPSCAVAGVLGALAGFGGALMGAEAVRILAGERGAYAGRLLVFEARSARARMVAVRPRPGCTACGGRGAEGTEAAVAPAASGAGT